MTTAGRCAVSFGGWVANLSGSPAGRDTLLEHCSPMRGTIGSIQPHHSITSFALIWPGVYQVEQISQSSKKKRVEQSTRPFPHPPAPQGTPALGLGPLSPRPSRGWHRPIRGVRTSAEVRILLFAWTLYRGRSLMLDMPHGHGWSSDTATTFLCAPPRDIRKTCLSLLHTFSPFFSLFQPTDR